MGPRLFLAEINTSVADLAIGMWMVHMTVSLHVYAHVCVYVYHARPHHRLPETRSKNCSVSEALCAVSEVSSSIPHTPEVRSDLPLYEHPF